MDYLKGDKRIWIIVLLLSLLSILAVYSSVVTYAHRFKNGNTFIYLVGHTFKILSGLGLIYVVHKLRFQVFSRISQIGIFIIIPLLLFTLIKGVQVGEASRWIEIPKIGLTFQSSDLAKFILIIYVARVIVLKRDVIIDFYSLIKYLLLPIGLICGLIFPANLSSAILLFVSTLFLMYVGGIKSKIFLQLLGVCFISIVLLLFIILKFPNAIPGGRGVTWKSRIEGFKGNDANKNYQIDQAKIAISTGGVFGKGPGNSSQRAFLPQASSDFIYAIIIEEYGIISGVIVLFLYLIFFYRCIKISKESEKDFGSLIVLGLSFSLVFQALLNMAIAVNLFPVSGQPLPLVSMGGSSIWISCVAIGIILNVSKTNKMGMQSKTEIN